MCAVNRCVAAEQQLFMLFCYRRRFLLVRFVFRIRSGSARCTTNQAKTKNTNNTNNGTINIDDFQLRFILMWNDFYYYNKNIERN